MPEMASITIKKNDGTTDIIYSALVPSAGDRSAAQWRSVARSANDYAGFRPNLSMTSRWNGTKTARRFDVTFVYGQAPTTDTSTGQVVQNNAAVATISFVVPQLMPQADIDEACTQLGNLLDSSLIVECFKAGAAPT